MAKQRMDAVSQLAPDSDKKTSKTKASTKKYHLAGYIFIPSNRTGRAAIPSPSRDSIPKRHIA